MSDSLLHTIRNIVFEDTETEKDYSLNEDTEGMSSDMKNVQRLLKWEKTPKPEYEYTSGMPKDKATTYLGGKIKGKGVSFHWYAVSGKFSHADIDKDIIDNFKEAFTKAKSL